MLRDHQIAFYTIAIFLLSFGVLAWNIHHDGIAAPYLDPIAKIRAQDEAPIVNSVLGMAKGGDWMTPHVAGRLFLFKPPLLIWLAALSVKMLGVGLFAIRLPSLVFGAAGVAAIFAWTAEARSKAAAMVAAGVMVASPFWQTFSRLCLTDVLCASCAALALACVAFDPQLVRRRTRGLFALLGAASILAKSVAGVLPFAALFLFFALTPRGRRPRIAAAAEIVVIAVVVLAPWYVYQVRVHPQWFWAENIQGQLLNTGLHWDRNSVIRSLPVLYYVRRVFEMDPVVLVLALAGIAGAFRVRHRPAAFLAVCWAAVAIAALCAFQAASLPYLVLVLPAISVAGAICAPGLLDRPVVAACIVGLLFIVTGAGAGAPWSLRPAVVPVAGAAAMRTYYDLHRDNRLVLFDPDDEFYSLTIPLPGVRYCVLDPTGILPRFVPHFAYLGILVSSDQFVRLPVLMPQFMARLKEWGVDSEEPVASTITMNTTAEIRAVVSANTETDFYVPTRWLDEIGDVEGDALDVAVLCRSGVFVGAEVGGEGGGSSGLVGIRGVVVWGAWCEAGARWSA